MPLYLINPFSLEATGPHSTPSEVGESAEGTSTNGVVVLNVDENGNVVSVDDLEEFLENNVDEPED